MNPLPWLLLALLALALALGLVGERLWRRRKEARAFLRGVRYVLSDDPDAAIAALSDAARLGSPEAVETYLALGALFRRTGDLARAIRLHRNMLLRPGLDPARRREVERELAHDYRRGGLREEALAAYQALAGAGDPDALEGLRDVLADSGRLAEAAEVQRRIGGKGGDELLAHLLAAEARAGLARCGRLGSAPPAAAGPAEAALEGAMRLAEAAVAAAPGSPDALLALAEARGAAGELEGALAAVLSALDREPSSALLAGPALMAAGDVGRALAAVDARLGERRDDAELRWLQGLLLQAAGREAEALAALRRALELDGSGAVTVAVRELLREAASPAPEALAARHDLLIEALLRRVRPFLCGRCGAEAPLRVWLCRRCGAFDSFVPPAAAGEGASREEAPSASP